MLELSDDTPHVTATVDSYIVGRTGCAAVLVVDGGKSITAPITDMSVPVGTEVHLYVVIPDPVVRGEVAKP